MREHAKTLAIGVSGTALVVWAWEGSESRGVITGFLGIGLWVWAVLRFVQGLNR